MKLRGDENLESLALEIHFRIQPGHRVEFLQTAETLISQATSTPGLNELGCFEEVGEANVFLWRESWDSVNDLEGRLESKGIMNLMAAIKVLGRLEHYEILAPRYTDRPPARWT